MDDFGGTTCSQAMSSTSIWHLVCWESGRGVDSADKHEEYEQSSLDGRGRICLEILHILKLSPGIRHGIAVANTWLRNSSSFLWLHFKQLFSFVAALRAATSWLAIDSDERPAPIDAKIELHVAQLP